jgi:hypothetical protein
MRRRLSQIEHIVEGNIVYLVRLEGGFSEGQLRSALSRVQRRHPALRALIREESDGLYYEADCAPEIPLRILSRAADPRAADDDYRRECQIELNNRLAYDKPQLRVVWIRAEAANDLLLTTSHRICDGMSIFTIVRETLRLIHSDEELTSYEPITTRDIVGGYQPPDRWRRKLAASLLNGVARLIPNSRREPENKEHCLEWSTDRVFLDDLKRRSRAEGVSIHAVLAVALDRSLLAVFGKKKVPKWIENPVDIRRGRFSALKNDMVFFGGGNFQLGTGQALDVEFWARARTIHEEIRKKVEQAVSDIPSDFQFSDMLCPLKRGQVQSIVRLGDALKMNGSWNRFALSNLGNVVVSDSDSPLRVKDLRLYMHSLSFRALCLVTYTLNGEMRFYCVSDERCMSRSQMESLQRELMGLLWKHVQAREDATKVSWVPATACG